ncbi:MAG: tRNA methyl transferase PRC-barrel domain-containing protein, partial [Planktomarina sp.]
FPLGEIDKSETRKIAERLNLNVATKPDSQDICFVPDGNYAAVIEKLHPGVSKPGDIVDASGAVLGQHNGVIHYTIGQRRGLGIGGLSDPIYVVKLDVDKNHVVVGPKSMLATRQVNLKEINWLGDVPLMDKTEWKIAAKVRSTRPPRDAILRPISNTEAIVELIVAEEGIAPGQACVFYDPNDTRVLGGGWITQG